VFLIILIVSLSVIGIALGATSLVIPIDKKAKQNITITVSIWVGMLIVSFLI
jgi:hypothetical protein